MDPTRYGGSVDIVPAGTPERWLARRHENGKIETADVYRTGDVELGDIVCPSGSEDGCEALHWQLLRRGRHYLTAVPG